MLNRGTAATIIMGVMPESPYIFSTNAMPKIAAEPRAAAWANAPTMDLSFRNTAPKIHVAANIQVVAIMQNITNFPEKSARMSMAAMSWNSCTGRATLNTNLSATAQKPSFSSPMRFKNPPTTMMMKIGRVTFRLNRKFCIFYENPFTGK